jgi:thiol-disulfide isomerase/thioredoxin
MLAATSALLTSAPNHEELSIMASPQTSRAPRTSFWTSTRLGLVAAALILIIAIVFALVQNKEATPATSVVTQPLPQNNAPAAAAPRPAAPAPGNPVALPDTVRQASFNLLDGKAKKLTDYEGKVVVVDLWATWCGPCRQEIPFLMEMAKEFKSKGVEVIGLTTENPATDMPVVKEFTKQFKINYPIGWANAPIAMGLMNGRNGIPQTLIIGRDGKVRNHFVGFNAMISVPQMKAAIEAAVAGA